MTIHGGGKRVKVVTFQGESWTVQSVRLCARDAGQSAPFFDGAAWRPGMEPGAKIMVLPRQLRRHRAVRSVQRRHAAPKIKSGGFANYKLKWDKSPCWRHRAMPILHFQDLSGNFRRQPLHILIHRGKRYLKIVPE